ncbi:hypothetical protein GCM10009737_31050 [Nocardioides lentus]|uniref:Alpha-amylase n=1 Tax=Nocardioides lentus TaxID=338077 RepID=A0ABP5B0V4_9ACTN
MRTTQLGRGARTTGLALAALALLMSVFVTVAGPAQAAETGRVRGEVLGVGGAAVDVTWATTDGVRSGTARATGGVYSLSLAPGTYRLTFRDRRPSYDVAKLAPTTVEVGVTAASTTQRTVRLTPGAAIGGTVRAGGRVAPKARVVAARTDQQVFETTADSRGRFALGGLPAGSYSVFTYDRAGRFTADSLWLPRLRAGRYTAVDLALRTRAGTLQVDVYAGGAPAVGTGYVTAVSLRTGQYWVARMVRGSVTFAGVAPGRYRLLVPGAGDWLGTTATPPQAVRSGRAAFATVRLTQQGAGVTGRLVDAHRSGVALADGEVRLLDGTGAVLATATTAADGTFRLGGQLTTRTDLRVVVGPGPYSPYLGQGTSYCKYDALTVAPVAVRTGAVTALGDLALPHLPDDQQDGAQCRAPATSPVAPASDPASRPDQEQPR